MFNYGDIIEYADATYDDNFNNAKRWCEANNATFNELIDRRVERDGILYRYFEIKENPAPTDTEISAIRAKLYASDSDNVFASYQQGVASLQDYIDAKAQISFDNKKSTQTSMTLDDFKHKVSREYELFKQSGKVIKNTTYDYKESSGTSDLVVSDADVTVNAVVNLWADKLEPVFFYLTKNGKEIVGSRVTYVPQVAHEHRAIIPTMSAKIQNGDVLGWGFETTSENGAYLLTDSSQYPMAELTIRTKGAV